MNDDRDIVLVYDRECPVCELYCKHIDIDPEAGKLQRVDAREQSDIMREITALGLDIDEGMVVKSDGAIYYGSDAINLLAQKSSRRGLFNRIAAAAFHRRTVARLLYPVMKFGRNLLLKLLGRSRINNLDTPGRDRF